MKFEEYCAKLMQDDDIKEIREDYHEHLESIKHLKPAAPKTPQMPMTQQQQLKDLEVIRKLAEEALKEENGLVENVNLDNMAYFETNSEKQLHSAISIESSTETYESTKEEKITPSVMSHKVQERCMAPRDSSEVDQSILMKQVKEEYHRKLEERRFIQAPAEDTLDEQLCLDQKGHRISLFKARRLGLI